MLPPTVRSLLNRDLHCRCPDCPLPAQLAPTANAPSPLSASLIPSFRCFLASMASRAEDVTIGCGGALCALTRRLVRYLPRRVAEPTGPLDVLFDIFLGLIVAKGASVREISQIPVSVVTSVSGKDDRCPICLASFENGDVTKVLPCSHTFHAECIDCWLTRKSLCPTCKADVC